MQPSAQGTAEPDLEVPLLFNIQDEMLSVFKDDNVKAANHTVNATSDDFAVRAGACSSIALTCVLREGLAVVAVLNVRGP